jgi:hypothetical protein
MANFNGDNKNKPVLSGSTVLDKLLNQLPKDDREFVLRLMAELGIKADDPTHPLLAAMQYYVSILRDIPKEMRESADDAFRKAIAVYGNIQGQIDNSATRIEAGVEQLDSIRVQWIKQAEALLPTFKTAFNASFEASLKTVEAGYKLKAEEVEKTKVKEWKQNLENFRREYFSDIRKMVLAISGGVLVVPLLVGMSAAYWFGVQQGRSNAVKEFGNEDWYSISRELINRADNKQRLINCNKDDNPKCTVWLRDPQ